MKKARLTLTVAAMLLCAGTALATPTPQENCDYARITAWKVYTACVDVVVAKNAQGAIFDKSAAFAKCRHTYFKKWAACPCTGTFGVSTCVCPSSPCVDPTLAADTQPYVFWSATSYVPDPSNARSLIFSTGEPTWSGKIDFH